MNKAEAFQKKWCLQSSELPRVEEHLQTGSGVALKRARVVANSPFDIIGRYSAFIVVKYVDAAVAQACLPSYLRLDPPPGTPLGEHPVMYSFGTHNQVHPRFFTLWEYAYAEALVGIPNVALQDSGASMRQPLFHMTAVRLNNRFADEIGVAMGFPKKLAEFKISSNSYSFKSKEGAQPEMSGAFHISGPPFDSNFPNFQFLERYMLQQPVITKDSLGSLLKIPFHIYTETALMRPETATIEITGTDLPCLPAGKYVFPGIDEMAIGGGYRSVHYWKMSPPSTVSI